MEYFKNDKNYNDDDKNNIFVMRIKLKWMDIKK